LKPPRAIEARCGASRSPPKLDRNARLLRNSRTRLQTNDCGRRSSLRHADVQPPCALSSADARIVRIAIHVIRHMDRVRNRGFATTSGALGSAP